MKILLLFLGSTVLSLPLLAQVESLETKLATTDRDTARVNTLNKLATLHFNSAPEKAHIYMNKALALADSLHYKRGQAEAHLTEAMIFRLEGQTNHDLESLIKAMHLFESMNDSL